MFLKEQIKMSQGDVSKLSLNTVQKVVKSRDSNSRPKRPARQQLIKWAIEHQDHPYPSPEEKIKLCKLTGLSIIQISDWFCQYRMRLKRKKVAKAQSNETDVNQVTDTGGLEQPVKCDVPILHEITSLESAYSSSKDWKADDKGHADPSNIESAYEDIGHLVEPVSARNTVINVEDESASKGVFGSSFARGTHKKNIAHKYKSQTSSTKYDRNIFPSPKRSSKPSEYDILRSPYLEPNGRKQNVNLNNRVGFSPVCSRYKYTHLKDAFGSKCQSVPAWSGVDCSNSHAGLHPVSNGYIEVEDGIKSIVKNGLEVNESLPIESISKPLDYGGNVAYNTLSNSNKLNGNINENIKHSDQYCIGNSSKYCTTGVKDINIKDSITNAHDISVHYSASGIKLSGSVKYASDNNVNDGDKDPKNCNTVSRNKGETNILSESLANYNTNSINDACISVSDESVLLPISDVICRVSRTNPFLEVDSFSGKSKFVVDGRDHKMNGGYNSVENRPLLMNNRINSATNGPCSMNNSINSAINGPCSMNNGNISATNGPCSMNNSINSTTNGPCSMDNGNISATNGPCSMNKGINSATHGPNLISNVRYTGANETHQVINIHNSGESRPIRMNINLNTGVGGIEPPVMNNGLNSSVDGPIRMNINMNTVGNGHLGMNIGMSSDTNGPIELDMSINSGTNGLLRMCNGMDMAANIPIQNNVEANGPCIINSGSSSVGNVPFPTINAIEAHVNAPLLLNRGMNYGEHGQVVLNGGMNSGANINGGMNSGENRPVILNRGMNSGENIPVILNRGMNSGEPEIPNIHNKEIFTRETDQNNKNIAELAIGTTSTNTLFADLESNAHEVMLRKLFTAAFNTAPSYYHKHKLNGSKSSLPLSTTTKRIRYSNDVKDLTQGYTRGNLDILVRNVSSRSSDQQDKGIDNQKKQFNFKRKINNLTQGNARGNLDIVVRNVSSGSRDIHDKGIDNNKKKRFHFKRTINKGSHKDPYIVVDNSKVKVSNNNSMDVKSSSQYWHNYKIIPNKTFNQNKKSGKQGGSRDHNFKSHRPFKESPFQLEFVKGLDTYISNANPDTLNHNSVSVEKGCCVETPIEIENESIAQAAKNVAIQKQKEPETSIELEKNIGKYSETISSIVKQPKSHPEIAVCEEPSIRVTPAADSLRVLRVQCKPDVSPNADIDAINVYHTGDGVPMSGFSSPVVTTCHSSLPNVKEFENKTVSNYAVLMRKLTRENIRYDTSSLLDGGNKSNKSNSMLNIDLNNNMPLNRSVSNCNIFSHKVATSSNSMLLEKAENKGLKYNHANLPSMHTCCSKNNSMSTAYHTTTNACSNIPVTTPYVASSTVSPTSVSYLKAPLSSNNSSPNARPGESASEQNFTYSQSSKPDKYVCSDSNSNQAVKNTPIPNTRDMKFRLLGKRNLIEKLKLKCSNSLSENLKNKSVTCTEGLLTSSNPSRSGTYVNSSAVYNTTEGINSSRGNQMNNNCNKIIRDKNKIKEDEKKMKRDCYEMKRDCSQVNRVSKEMNVDLIQMNPTCNELNTNSRELKRDSKQLHRAFNEVYKSYNKIRRDCMEKNRDFVTQAAVSNASKCTFDVQSGNANSTIDSITDIGKGPKSIYTHNTTSFKYFPDPINTGQKIVDSMKVSNESEHGKANGKKSILLMRLLQAIDNESEFVNLENSEKEMTKTGFKDINKCCGASSVSSSLVNTKNALEVSTVNVEELKVRSVDKESPVYGAIHADINTRNDQISAKVKSVHEEVIAELKTTEEIECNAVAKMVGINNVLLAGGCEKEPNVNFTSVSPVGCNENNEICTDPSDEKVEDDFAYWTCSGSSNEQTLPHTPEETMHKMVQSPESDWKNNFASKEDNYGL